MRKLVLGTLFGFLVAATAALAYDVTFPTRLKVQAHALVDELGHVLLGSTPARIEVTNWPSGGGSSVTGVRDSNSALLGTISRTYAPGGAIEIARNVGGVLVEMVATHFTLAGNAPAAQLYYESTDCTGPAYINPGGSFYPTTVREGDSLLYASAPPSPVDVNSNKQTGAQSCIVFSYAQAELSPTATLDLTQFPAPYYVE